jgi:hypothetical protein
VFAVIPILLAQLVRNPAFALSSTARIALSQLRQLLFSTDIFQLHCLRFRVTFSREATICFPPLPNPPRVTFNLSQLGSFGGAASTLEL